MKRESCIPCVEVGTLCRNGYVVSKWVCCVEMGTLCRSGYLVSKWVPCVEILKRGLELFSVPKKHFVWVRLQCSHASRKFFLSIEDGPLEEMEGAEYNIRPGLLAESRDTREKKFCIPLEVLSVEITKESARGGLELLDLSKTANTMPSDTP